MNVYKPQAIRGVQRNKNRINAFPKYLMETGNSALEKLVTSIYLRKMDPHEYASGKNGEGGGFIWFTLTCNRNYWHFCNERIHQAFIKLPSALHFIKSKWNNTSSSSIYILFIFNILFLASRMSIGCVAFIRHWIMSLWELRFTPETCSRVHVCEWFMILYNFVHFFVYMDDYLWSWGRLSL